MLTQRNREKIRHALLCNANLFPKENSIALFLCVKKTTSPSNARISMRGTSGVWPSTNFIP
jgi:hypothetical protein